MEMRCAQRVVAPSRRPPRLPLRRHFPPGGRLQGPQPRYRLVLDPRSRMAGAQASVRALARAGKFRRRRMPARVALEAHAHCCAVPLRRWPATKPGRLLGPPGRASLEERGRRAGDAIASRASRPDTLPRGLRTTPVDHGIFPFEAFAVQNSCFSHLKRVLFLFLDQALPFHETLFHLIPPGAAAVPRRSLGRDNRKGARVMGMSRIEADIGGAVTSSWRELWRKEDYWAIWLGLGIVVVAYALFVSGSSIKWLAVTPAKWSTLSQLGAHF